MNRHYTQASYLALVERLYCAMPDLALTTDLIVGFPGETDEDFEETMRVVEAARYDQAFTFIYSPREGTPAAAHGRPGPQGGGPAAVRPARGGRPVLGAAQEPAARGHGPARPRRGRQQARRPRSVGPHREATRWSTPRRRPASPQRDLAGTFVDVTIQDAQTWFLMGTLNT